MRLEMATTTVRDVRLSDRTRIDDGVLEIDRAGLRKLLLEDDAFADVTIEVARPGESARIIHVMDAAEPRWKPEPGSTFPLFVGPPKTVGEGRTLRLDGIAVVSTSDAVAGEPTYWREGIIDMVGPVKREIIKPLLRKSGVEFIGEVGGREKDVFLNNAAALLFRYEQVNQRE